MSGSDYYDNEFKAILCHQNGILVALGSMLFGMNMYNKGLQYNYVFESLSGNGSKRYSAADLYQINNLGVSGKCAGEPYYNSDIDKEYICLVKHASLYMSVIVAVRMAQQALSDGRNYVFTFNVPGKGHKSYSGVAVMKLAEQASKLSNTCTVDPDSLTRCTDYFCSFS